jgi:hypothetical protein
LPDPLVHLDELLDRSMDKVASAQELLEYLLQAAPAIRRELAAKEAPREAST